MSSLECKFCKKNYSSVSSLNYHQKTAKYCLKIQQISNVEVKKVSFDCEYCNKQFSSKQRLKVHIENCLDKYKKITQNLKDNIDTNLKKYNLTIVEKDIRIKDLEKIILDLENKVNVIAVETEVRILRERDERSTATVEEIAKQPRINASITTNNNQKVLINTPMDMSHQTLNHAIQSGFSGEYLVQGQKGVARFAYDNILKDEEGKLKYICTDAARQIFQYKNEDGSMQKDVRATKLTKALLGSELKSTSHKIACESMRKGGDQEFMNYTDHYQDIREMETDNSDFSKELCTLVV